MSELYHYGIKGMKWGVRRTPEQLGHSPFKSDTPASLSSKRQIADASRNITNEARNITNTIGRNKRVSKVRDLSEMTDQELRDAINRMNMEQQYKSLTANQTSRGESYLNEILELGGSALAVTSSVLGIALAIKQLRG